MRVLAVHAHYAQPGGEDEVFRAERDLLLTHGHTVFEHVEDNASIQGQSRLALAARTLWSQGDYHRIRALIRTNGIDLVAVHNFFPLISPAVFYAARAEAAGVVQTLHNYRLICPKATLFREGRLCDDCVGRRFALPAIEHGCYRGSRLLTGVLASMTALHSLAGTWDRMVTRYIALTPYMKEWFVAGGFPAEKICVKPNFTADTPPGTGMANRFVFVGRLTVEKGVSVLLEAWRRASLESSLHILGTGPDEIQLRAQASGMPNVHFLGQQPRSRVQEEMGLASAVIVPSLWPEPFGLTVIEALAKGTPVLATEDAGMASLLEPGRGGFVFPRGDAEALAALLRDGPALARLRGSAREVYERRFTPARNYSMLHAIYEEALTATPNRRRQAGTNP